MVRESNPNWLIAKKRMAMRDSDVVAAFPIGTIVTVEVMKAGVCIDLRISRGHVNFSGMRAVSACPDLELHDAEVILSGLTAEHAYLLGKSLLMAAKQFGVIE